MNSLLYVSEKTHVLHLGDESEHGGINMVLAIHMLCFDT